MTKYRTVSDGYCTYLQYQKTFNLFFLFPIKYWSYIFQPYYDEISGRALNFKSDTCVCDYNNNLEKFVKRWTNIDEYFKYAKNEQKRLKEKAKKYNSNIKKKSKEIKYF